MSKTDYELLNGDSDDFTILYRKYNHDLHRFIGKFQFGRLPADIHELIQLVWIRVNEKKKLYRSECKFKNWLYKLSIRVVLNYGRDERIQRLGAKNYPLDILEDIVDPSLEEPIEDVIAYEVIKVVREAIAGLSDIEQEAIRMVYFEKTETTNGPYRSAIRRARKKLQNTLKEV